MMAAGKTVVGGELAQLLGRRFADTDAIIAAAAGTSVHALFAQEGEAGFRARERALAADLGHYHGHVLALGGGMFVGEEMVGLIRRAARTIWLQASAETLGRRLDAAGTAARPMLAGEDPAARLRTLLAERSPWYAQADLAVPTDGLSPRAVARAIATAFGCA
jgi:shikimate kinase